MKPWFPIRSGQSSLRLGLHRRKRVAALALAMFAATAAGTSAHGGAVRDDPNQHWLAAWAASPQAPDPLGVSDAGILSKTGFEGQTIREIVYLHIGGPQVRVKLTNTFGNQTLTVGQVDVAVASDSGSTFPGTDRQVTFDGRGTVNIPPWAEAYSDPVDLNVDPLQTVAVSLYFPAPTGPITWHQEARQTLYRADGNEAANPDGAAFEALTAATSWYALAGIDVPAAPGQSAIVALGDSITDGTRSTQDANNRWPDYLARRLGSLGNPLSVVNEGISSNRVLTDVVSAAGKTLVPSVNALARVNRDVLSQDGARYVILLEGINDIGQACLGTVDNSAEDIIGGYQQLITQVHAKGIKIFGATLTPFQGALHDTPFSNYYCDVGEGKRGVLNNWIRASGEFDGVIDFDQAVRDPSNPLMYLPKYDSGDHLHPSDAGYEAMANAIDLSLFAP